MDRLVALLCRADVAGAVSQHSLPFLCAHPPPSQSLRSTLRWRRWWRCVLRLPQLGWTPCWRCA